MANLLGLHPEVRRRLFAMMDALRGNGWEVRVTSAYRTHAEQRRLYESRRGCIGCLPVAAPGRSTHEYGFAVDLVTDYPDLDELGQAFGFAWAGPRDPVHFDVFGAAWPQILAQAS